MASKATLTSLFPKSIHKDWERIKHYAEIDKKLRTRSYQSDLDLCNKLRDAAGNLIYAYTHWQEGWLGVLLEIATKGTLDGLQVGKQERINLNEIIAEVDAYIKAQGL